MAIAVMEAVSTTETSVSHIYRYTFIYSTPVLILVPYIVYTYVSQVLSNSTDFQLLPCMLLRLYKLIFLHFITL
jgi:hypothetical protein